MVELLAPAGSREAFTAALESGADAIYLGGRLFGARHYAPNFTDEELGEAVRDAHLRGVAIFVTVNILIDEAEISAVVDYLRYLYSIGVDAIIVQDMGVAAIARKVTPGLPIHASTQMTVLNLAGVEFLAERGFSRVVLARELSLEEIRHICLNATIEIEVFIHGALCISYSGQCLMSSMIGGRSGNRGKCAQPCRLPYTLVDGSGKNVLTAEEAG
jgi:putative protease